MESPRAVYLAPWCSYCTPMILPDMKKTVFDTEGHQPKSPRMTVLKERRYTHKHTQTHLKTHPTWHLSTVGVVVMKLKDDDCGYDWHPNDHHGAGKVLTWVQGVGGWEIHSLKGVDNLYAMHNISSPKKHKNPLSKYTQKETNLSGEQSLTWQA